MQQSLQWWLAIFFPTSDDVISSYSCCTKKTMKCFFQWSNFMSGSFTPSSNCVLLIVVDKINHLICDVALNLQSALCAWEEEKYFLRLQLCVINKVLSARASEKLCIVVISLWQHSTIWFFHWKKIFSPLSKTSTKNRQNFLQNKLIALHDLWLYYKNILSLGKPNYL